MGEPSVKIADMQRKTIWAVGWFLLFAVGKWLLDNGLFDWLVRYLADTWNIQEANLIASISSYVIPGGIGTDNLWYLAI